MIFETIDFLTKEVNKYLNLKLGLLNEPRLVYGNIARAFETGALGDDKIEDKAVVSLVNIEEDRVSKQQQNFIRSDASTIYKNPPIYLNLYLLFALNKPDYKKSLEILGAIMQFFQHQQAFNSSNYPSLNSGIEALIVDLYSLNFEQINHLWSTLGGKYLPSVMYKVRQITLDENATISESGFIKEIQINDGLKQPVS